MNSKLLLRHRVNIQNQYIGFLQFLHPNFELVDGINVKWSEYDNPNPVGIIYADELHSDTVEQLDSLTSNWIIVNGHHFDDDISSNEGLYKAILPISYAQIKKSLKKGDIPVYNTMDYGTLIEKIKVCLIDHSQMQSDSVTNQSVYNLFAAILGTPDVLNTIYFNMVDSSNVSRVASSILTFLNKVQLQKISNESVYYARLISQSNKRYGKFIKQGIYKFVKSNANLEIALHQLLLFLNRAR